MHIFLFAALFLGVMGSNTLNGRIFFQSDSHDRNLIREDTVAELVQKTPPDLVMVLTGKDLERSENNINGQSFKPKKKYVVDERPKCTRSSPYAVLCVEDEEYDEDVKYRFELAAKKANLSEDGIPEMISRLMAPESSPHTNDQYDKNATPVCPVIEEEVTPKRGKTKRNEWVYVFNHGEMKQGVMVEKCLNHVHQYAGRFSEMNCFGDTGEEEKSVCEQKYIYKPMLTLDTDGNDIVIQSIEFPSCCVCVRWKLYERYLYPQVPTKP